MLNSGWLILILICIIIGSVLYKLNKNRETTIHFTPKINRLMTGYCFNFLSKSQCKFIIDSAEKHTWTKKRHKYFPTVDQQVETLPELNFLSDKVTNELFPKIRDLYTFENLTLNDFFIVKYNSNGDNMDKLDIHRDTSLLNFVVSLNDPDSYIGGGTVYPEFNKIVRPEQGDIFINCGKLKHGGGKIVNGVRYILIGFVDVECNSINTKYLDSIRFKLDIPSIEVMHNVFIKKLNIYIINLKNRTDRKKYLLKHIDKIKVPDGFKVNVNVVEADTGLTGNSYPEWKLNKDSNYNNLDYPASVFKYWQRDISQAEIGCFNSHLKIIRKIASSNNDDENTINLVLEDDADFSENFFQELKNHYCELIENDVNWDICFLGRNALDKKNKKLSENIEDANYTYNAHCYLISNKTCKVIVNIDNKNKIIPFDEYLPALSWSHPRKEINKLFLPEKEKLKSYASTRKLCWQKSYGYSDIN